MYYMELDLHFLSWESAAHPAWNCCPPPQTPKVSKEVYWSQFHFLGTVCLLFTVFNGLMNCICFVPHSYITLCGCRSFLSSTFWKAFFFQYVLSSLSRKEERKIGDSITWLGTYLVTSQAYMFDSFVLAL